MVKRRGALIIIEGCDRAGKSTQTKLLVKALNDQGIPAEHRAFPNRTTIVGSVLNNFLSNKNEIPPESAHLIFSANRWECKRDIIDSLQKGTTLIVDRYAASGAAYTAATTGRSLSWCKEPDRGLPLPDLVVYLEITPQCQHARKDWGNERFENSNLQQKVAENYEKLKDKSWEVIDANQNPEKIHNELLKIVVREIQKNEHNPIGQLYN